MFSLRCYFRYQRDLVAATERQQSLEREKTQVELDWQRRTEGVRTNPVRKVRGSSQIVVTGSRRGKNCVLYVTSILNISETCYTDFSSL